MKTIKMNNKPVIYNIKDVNRVFIDIGFAIDTKKENPPVIDLLKRLLGGYSNSYKDNQVFFNKLDELYILRYRISSYFYKDISYIRFSLSLPKEDIIDEFSLEEALIFFKDVIFNPYIDKDKFNDKAFDLEKGYLLDREKPFPRDIEEYVGDKYWKFIDKREELGINHDNYMEVLKSITSKDLYDYYMKYIFNNNYFVYIYGNVIDKNKYLEVFNKVFNTKDKVISKKVSFYKFRRDFKEEHKEEITKYNQSVLCLNYVIKNMTIKEGLLFDVLFDILSAKENALIYNELRTKNNLIYSSRIYQKKHYGFFNVFIYYNDANYKDIIDIVNNAIKSLYEKEVFEKCKERLVTSLKYGLLYKEDDPFDKVYSKVEVKFFDEIDFNKRIKLTEEVTHEEFKTILDKVILTKSYLFIGGDNNA